MKASQKTREKERTFDSNLFDDNIDIFADLTVKPKEKSKKKVEAKSIFDDDMGKFSFLYMTERVITVQRLDISPATFVLTLSWKMFPSGFPLTCIILLR